MMIGPNPLPMCSILRSIVPTSHLELMHNRLFLADHGTLNSNPGGSRMTLHKMPMMPSTQEMRMPDGPETRSIEER